MVILSLAVDLLMLYLTRGKLAPSMQKAGKVAKKFKKFKGFMKSNDLSFTLPKISMNAGIYKEQYTKSLDDTKDLALPKVATIFEYRLQAKPFLALNHTYALDPKVLTENLKELKKFKLEIKTTGEINFDLKIKYHSLAKTFIVEDYDTGKVYDDLELEDVFRMQGAINITINAHVKGQLKREFNLFWDLVSVKTTLKAEGKLNVTSGMGVSRKIGVDPIIGPYLEDVFFFNGVKGTYLLSGSASANDVKIEGATNDNKPKSFTLFESKTTSFGKNYLFELFSKPPE